jgi:hypothetical protein
MSIAFGPETAMRHLVVYHSPWAAEQRSLESEAAEKNNNLATIIIFSGGSHCYRVRNP